jgi:hypothetical protein
MTCPLAIDWLEWLDAGRHEKSLHDHFLACRACTELVQLLEPQVGRRPLEGWRDGVDLSRALVLAEDRNASAAVGDFWFTSGPEGGVDRFLAIVLAGPLAEFGEEWYEVAPVALDVENAFEVELLLRADDSSLQTPMRVQFEMQGVVGREQLFSRAGALTGSGTNVLETALTGVLDESRWGTRLESADDPRMRMNEGTAVAFELLRSPYHSYVEAAERVELASVAALLAGARARRGISRAELAGRLAATLGLEAAAAKVKRYYADLENGLLDPSGLRMPVIDAIGQLLAIPRDRLISLQANWRPPAADERGLVYARADVDASPTAAAASPASEVWDDVDDLFRGAQS